VARRGGGRYERLPTEYVIRHLERYPSPQELEFGGGGRGVVCLVFDGSYVTPGRPNRVVSKSGFRVLLFYITNKRHMLYIVEVV
jgi:hypothetical protein